MASRVSQRESNANDSLISLSSLEWLTLKPRSWYRARMAGSALSYTRWNPARSYLNRHTP